MNLLQLLADHSTLTLLTLAVLAFVAGFLDAVVGGGGLIQLPALLIAFPQAPLPTLLGTGKIAGLSGTSVAAFQYSRRIKFDLKLLFVVALFAFVASFLGAKAVSLVSVDALRPGILVVLVIIAIYTVIKKDLGALQTKHLPWGKQALFGSFIGLVVGFYDGFFGPGAGSFLILGFVVVLGFEFVQASAYAKVINCFTNLSALTVFIRQGSFMLEIALLMAICNVAGNVLGSRIALRKGNGFVRILFLVVVGMLILRYAYDIWWVG